MMKSSDYDYVVVGAGSEIGDAFVKHPAPRLISFTGSTPVGKQVGANAVSGDTLKKVALELGGNAPLVVLDDADLDAAVDQAVQSLGGNGLTSEYGIAAAVTASRAMPSSPPTSSTNTSTSSRRARARGSSSQA